MEGGVVDVMLGQCVMLAGRGEREIFISCSNLRYATLRDLRHFNGCNLSSVSRETIEWAIFIINVYECE